MAGSPESEAGLVLPRPRPVWFSRGRGRNRSGSPEAVAGLVLPRPRPVWFTRGRGLSGSPEA